MSACAELEGLLAERASGPIAAEDEARVAEHLATCAACTRIFEDYRRVFGLVALDAQPSTRSAPARGRERGDGDAQPRPSAGSRPPSAWTSGGAGPAAEGRGADTASIAPATLRAWRRRRQRRVTGIALGAGFGAAAAAAALVLAPAFHASRARPPTAVVASWETDVDAALDAAGAGDLPAAASSAGDDEELSAADVALAAYDDATSG